MESANGNTNTNNTQFQEIFDDHLEMIVQDFNEFRERMAESCSSGTIKFEDLIDLFINNGRENSCSTEHHTLLEDRNKSKNAPSPHHLQSELINGFNINTQIQETEITALNTSQNDGGFLESSKTLNMNSHVGVANRVTHIRYGDLNCHEAAYGIIGSVFGGSAATGLDSVIRCLRTNLGLKGYGDRTNNRTKVKRKYREDIEAEEEITKTKRETSTTAHANREFLEDNIIL